MSNGEINAADPEDFASGIAQDVEREDAQGAFDAKLLEIDDEIDALVSVLTAPVQAAIAQASNVSIAVRADLGGALARSQLQIERDADVVRGALQAAGDAAVDAVVVEAGALRDVLTAEPRRVTAFVAGSGETFRVPGSNVDLQVCAGSVTGPGLLFVAFPGIGQVGPYTLVLEPDPVLEPGGRIEDTGTPGIFRYSQSIRVNGPGCDDGAGGPIYTTVFQGERPTFYGEFGPSACMVVPTCWLEPSDAIRPIRPEIDTAPDVASVPDVPPETLGARTRGVGPPVVALACSRGVLAVVDRSEADADPDLLIVGECGPGEEFDLAALLARCPATDAVTPDDDPTGGFPKISDFKVSLPFEGCELPRFITSPALDVANRNKEVEHESLLGSVLQAALSHVPVLGKLSVDKQADFTRNEWKFDEARKVRDQWSKTCAVPSNWREAAEQRALLQQLNEHVPGYFAEPLIAINQAAQRACPKRVPSAEAGLSAWLANEISLQELQCIVTSNGFVWDKWVHVAMASRNRPGIVESMAMLRRKILTPQEFANQVRETGWTRPDEIQNMLRVTEQVPGPSDLVRFMVRDAADEKNIDWTKSDASFRQKFTGPMLAWAEAQALPDDVLKFHWRAHWEIPSPTQLFTMQHRLGRARDGKEDDKYTKRVKAALQQDDVSPNWIDDLMAINFRLPRRADLRRVFRVGIFSEADLMAEFVKQGLETKTAEGLVEFEIREKKRAFANNPLVAKYSRGEINAGELADELGKLGADAAGKATALNRGKLLMRMRRRNRCLEAIRHRVLIGEIDTNESAQLALQQTQDADQAFELSETWKCERDSKSKSTTAAELCKWFKDNVITAAQFISQLRAIGFSRELAESKFTACQLDKSQALDKLQERERKRAQREADKKAAAGAAQGKRSEAATRSRIANLKLARKAMDRREKRVTDAARTLVNRNDLDFDATLAGMMRFYRSQLRLALIDADELADAVLTAAKVKSVSGLESWRGRVETIIDVVA